MQRMALSALALALMAGSLVGCGGGGGGANAPVNKQDVQGATKENPATILKPPAPK